MTDDTQRFNAVAFFKALDSTVAFRKMKWKDVSEATGVSPSTLSRMAQGKGPDASSLAVLSAWAGLNPADYTYLADQRIPAEPLALLTSQLRKDPRLTPEAADALDAMIRAAYLQMTDRKI